MIRMRITLIVGLLLVAAPSYAQELVRGFAVDAASGLPLRCVDVTLQDSAGHAVSRTLTEADGSFRLDAPAVAAHRLEFAVWRHTPVTAEMQVIESSSPRLPIYSLTFDPTPGLPLLLWPDSVDSPPGLPVKFTRLKYPTNLVMRGLGGSALVRYVVDSTGRVDRTSIEVLESSDRSFARSVVDYLREVQFAPARRANRPVCALEYQYSFTFNAHP